MSLKTLLAASLTLDLLVAIYRDRVLPCSCFEMAECTCAESSESSEYFGTAGSPPSTPSDDSATSVQGEQRIINQIAKRHNRPNTIDEKRAMRKERKNTSEGK